MALFIQEKNQKLLWDMVNRISNFRNLSIVYKESEFKNIIQYIYQKYSMYSLTVSQLQQVNRETMDLFAKRFSPPIQPNAISVPTNPIFSKITNGFLENREEKSQRQFQERQQLYEQMTTKPNFPSADIFLEKKNQDEIVITDDYIQEYQKQRNQDFFPFENPPVSIDSKTSPSIIQKPKWKVIDTIGENVIPEIETFDILNSNVTIVEPSFSKKNVSWSENIIDPISEIDYQWQKIREEFQEKITNLEKRIIFLESELEKTKLIQPIESISEVETI